MRPRTATWAPMATALLISACATAGGDLDPTAPTLVDADGAWRSVDSARGDRDALVLVWWASACPCVARYAERVAAVRDRYADAPLAFAYVASNADDVGPTIAARGDLALPVLRDPGGRVARALGVVSTPTVVVIDRAGAVRYHGWLDNERDVGVAGREPWLEQALDALLAGEALARRRPTWGCTITRSLGETRVCATPSPLPDSSPVAAPTSAPSCH